MPVSASAFFFRSWLHAGHLSQLKAKGDYFTFAVLDQSLFAIRVAEGGGPDAVKVFYNVCQHRAHALVKGSGRSNVLVCPYHAWTYELDGRLRRAPNDSKVPGFKREDICLTEVRSEIFCGFLFVNLDPDAAPMADWFPGAEEELRAFVPDIDGLAPLTTVEVEEACNWKVTVENYNECYHCRLVHPTFAKGVIDPECYNVAPQGRCLRHTTKAAHPERLTYPVDPNSNPHAMDYSSWFLWPTVSFQVYPGGLLNSYHWRPLAVDRTHVARVWYSKDGIASETVEAMAIQDRDTTLAEDISLVESVQIGLSNRGYKPGPLILDPAQGVNSEHSIAALHRWVREDLGELSAS